MKGGGYSGIGYDASKSGYDISKAVPDSGKPSHDTGTVIGLSASTKPFSAPYVTPDGRIGTYTGSVSGVSAKVEHYVPVTGNLDLLFGAGIDKPIRPSGPANAWIGGGFRMKF
ncbi:MAG: hypothetical protein LBD36_03120 [Holosporales bacterium]|jgi:hypothetical protein|nr:hypothetical protein [Holosporales bacterium]